MSAIAWEGPLSTREVAWQLTEALVGAQSQSRELSEEVLRAEVLRVAIWEQSVLTQPHSLEQATVSTQRLLRRARFLWQPILSDFNKMKSSEGTFAEDGLSRQTLESLAEQGDLLSLEKGRWLPAPLRLVPLSQDRYLLVGGIPASLLARTIFQKLYLHGSFRQLDASLAQKHLPFDGSAEPWQFQTQESWLGDSPLSFDELLRRFLEVPLLPQTTQYNTEVYIPLFGKPQSNRWLPLDRISERGRYLLRSQKRWGQRFYTIGYIENGQIKEQSQDLESWDVRRLCYALDDNAQAPTCVKWNRRDGVLTLYSELPGRERKRLALLGTLQANGTNLYYPRLWRIQPRYEQNMKKVLRDIAIVIHE